MCLEIEQDMTTESGIHMVKQGKYLREPKVARVVKLSEGLATPLEIGDFVFYAKNLSPQTVSERDGENYVVINHTKEQDEIIGFVREKDFNERKGD